MSETHELSMDARVLITAWFRWGPKCTVRIGGVGAQSILSDRASAAMTELISSGYVTAKEFNHFGRMECAGTDKCMSQTLSQGKMTRYGKWSATQPNPQANREAVNV